MAWWRSQSVTTTIALLFQHADELRQRELNKTLRLIPDLTDEQKIRIEGLSNSITKKLLHTPVRTLRDGNAPEDARTIVRLFELQPHEAGMGAVRTERF